MDLLRTRIIDRTMSTVKLRGGIDLETPPAPASWKHSRGFTAISLVMRVLLADRPLPDNNCTLWGEQAPRALNEPG